MLTHFESLTGKGVKASVGTEDFFLGNVNLLTEMNVNVSTEIMNIASTWQKEAKTVVYFSDKTDVIAILAIADKIKSTSAAAIDALQKKTN
jgi:Cu2+-exporting ATPase